MGGGRGTHLLPRACPVLDGVGSLELQLLAHRDRSRVWIAYDTGGNHAPLATLFVEGLGVVVLASFLVEIG